MGLKSHEKYFRKSHTDSAVPLDRKLNTSVAGVVLNDPAPSPMSHSADRVGR